MIQASPSNSIVARTMTCSVQQHGTGSVVGEDHLDAPRETLAGNAARPRLLRLGRRRIASGRGLSLLEVMLALAILGISIAIIAELMRSAARDAEEARDLTTAQMLCEAKMNEIVAGLLPPLATVDIPIEGLETADSPGAWAYSILVEQVGQDGLISVTVDVHQNPQLVPRPVTFSLTRWMVDPNSVALQAADAATSGSSASAAGGSGGL